MIVQQRRKSAVESKSQVEIEMNGRVQKVSDDER